MSRYMSRSKSCAWRRAGASRTSFNTKKNWQWDSNGTPACFAINATFALWRCTHFLQDTGFILLLLTSGPLGGPRDPMRLVQPAQRSAFFGKPFLKGLVTMCSTYPKEMLRLGLRLHKRVQANTIPLSFKCIPNSDSVVPHTHIPFFSFWYFFCSTSERT